MKEGKAKVFTEQELRRTLRVISKKSHAKRNTALLWCSFGLGLRAKELASLRVENVLGADDQLLEEINLSSAMTKGAKQRFVYLTNSSLTEALGSYLAERQTQEGILFNPQAALFISQKGGAFTPNTLQQLFHRLFTEAKIQGASSHSGRRTFATTLIEKGADIKAVSRLMGHSSISMTAQYVEDNPLRLKEICRKLF
ncbi:site-specific integrase [Polynucleobacter sp. AP-RePozz3-80-G7]|uniref:tyrosine-type recombinase/integrase n=1 Tax=Polynucleobacter sp. AP-RePozz3-80-G7 TaxID=2689105 RepID=UPI001C0AF4EE|nr:site-specific integrase [Polynucleobacter sp. AP-RePozz3-80-G7]MBU3638751.1 site-specific integrase [Polynucleobacter sp. AP-RePozz3-80-G7]